MPEHLTHTEQINQPTIVLQLNSTTVDHPGMRGRLDPLHNDRGTRRERLNLTRGCNRLQLLVLEGVKRCDSP